MDDLGGICRCLKNGWYTFKDGNIDDIMRWNRWMMAILYLLWRDESVLVGLHIVIIILQRRIGFLASRVMLGLSVLAVPVVQNILAIAVLAMRCAYPNLGPTLFFSSSFFLRTISFWTFAFPDPIVFRIAFYSLSLHKNSSPPGRVFSPLQHG